MSLEGGQKEWVRGDSLRFWCPREGKQKRKGSLSVIVYMSVSGGWKIMNTQGVDLYIFIPICLKKKKKTIAWMKRSAFHYLLQLFCLCFLNSTNISHAECSQLWSAPFDRCSWAAMSVSQSLSHSVNKSTNSSRKFKGGVKVLENRCAKVSCRVKWTPHPDVHSPALKEHFISHRKRIPHTSKQN